MMQAFYKTVASFLSIAIIFTSIPPAFAHTHANAHFSASDAFESAALRQRDIALAKGNDAWWVEQGEKLVNSRCKIQGLPCILEDIFKAQQAAPKHNILHAAVCDNKNGAHCVPALAYAWGGVRYATQHLLYHQNKPIIETAPQFTELVSTYGLNGENERQIALRYFYDLIALAKKDCSNGSLEVGSQRNRADTRRANQLKSARCTAELAAMPGLAVISKTKIEKKKAAETIYQVLADKYDAASGGAVIITSVTALGILATPRAYSLLEKFLTQDTIPSTAGNIWEGTLSPGKYLAQNSLRAASNIRGGNSRYLNRINEQFQYLDKTEAKRQGFTNISWQSEGRQYPYANILEEVGVFIAQQSGSNPSAYQLAKKLVARANKTAQSKTNAAGILHYPLVLGILDGWRMYGKRFIYEPSLSLLSLFYKGDWFDINEGTQRHVHYKAYLFAKARGWTWKAPQFDKGKKQRYIYNARIMGAGEAADIIAPLLLVEGLFRIVPVLAKGIPAAVRTLRGRTALVGTKNYLKNTKIVQAAAKKAPARPAAAASKEAEHLAAINTAKQAPGAAKPAQPAKLTVAKVDNHTAQILPKGYTVEELNAGRLNIAPQTFASQGAPVANTVKVQPVMSQTASAAAGAAESATAAEVTPRWIWGKATNSIGQTVPSMVPNPAHPEYAQILAAQSQNASRPFSWKNLWTNMQLSWYFNKPDFSQLFKFGTSRYGIAGLGTGAAPLSSEAAIARAGNSVEIVQNIRAQQGMFIMEDALRGGAGAAYRTGAVNPGGVAAQRFAIQMAESTSAAGVSQLTPALNMASPWLKTAAVFSAGVLGTSMLLTPEATFADAVQPTLAMAPMFRIPSFLTKLWKNVRNKFASNSDTEETPSAESNTGAEAAATAQEPAQEAAQEPAKEPVQAAQEPAADVKDNTYQDARRDAEWALEKALYPLAYIRRTAYMPAQRDEDSNIPDIKPINAVFPTWEAVSEKLFSQEQQDALKEAFAATNDLLFVRERDGVLRARNNKEWDYESRFFTILQNSGKFTEKQIKQLIAGDGPDAVMIKSYLLLQKTNSFIITHGYFPRYLYDFRILSQNYKWNFLFTSISSFTWENELGKLAQQGNEYAADIKDELVLREAIAEAKKLKEPYASAFEREMELLKLKVEAFLVADVKAFIKEHYRFPRTTIMKRNKYMTVYELRRRAHQGYPQAAKIADELVLGEDIEKALQTWSKSSPYYQELKRITENKPELYPGERTRRKGMLANEPDLIEFIKEHNRLPRKNIRENGKKLSINELRLHALQGDTHAGALVEELELGAIFDDLTRYSDGSSRDDYERFIETDKKLKYEALTAKLESFIKKYNRSPRATISENGKKLTVAELRERAQQGDKQADELADELQLGQALTRALRAEPKDSPQYQELQRLTENNRRKRRADDKSLIAEIEAFIEKYNRSPRVGASENGKRLTVAELRERAQQGDKQADELADELQLGQSLNHALMTWAKDSPQYQELQRLIKNNRNKRTSKKTLITEVKAFIKKHHRLPRAGTSENGKPLTLAELRERAQQGDKQAAKLADELQLGSSLMQALTRWPKDSPEYLELEDIYLARRKR